MPAISTMLYCNNTCTNFCYFDCAITLVARGQMSINLLAKFLDQWVSPTVEWTDIDSTDESIIYPNIAFIYNAKVKELEKIYNLLDDCGWSYAFEKYPRDNEEVWSFSDFVRNLDDNVSSDRDIIEEVQETRMAEGLPQLQEWMIAEAIDFTFSRPRVIIKYLINE